jgi:hypothetical protein
MDRPAWAPADLDMDEPNAARMYDYYLGGSHNFRADRALANQAIEAFPDMARAAQANRAFLRRAVRFLVGAGVRQFLDIGSGIPTVGNVHQVAQAGAADARVVYVDTDPVAVSHSEALLARDPRTMVVQADGRDPGSVLGDPAVTGHLDLARPVGLLMFAFLHFVPDEEDPAGILAGYRAALAPGSHLAVSHGATPVERILQIYRGTRNPLYVRDRDELTALFAGFTLVDPGIVFLPQWHPEHPEDVGDHPEWTRQLGGVGVIP